MPSQANPISAYRSLIHSVAEYEPGMRSRVHFSLDPALPIFEEHFPGNPTYPASMLLNHICTAAVITIPALWDSVMRLTVQSASFRRPAKPGDHLQVDSTLQGSSNAKYEFKFVCRLLHVPAIVANGRLAISIKGAAGR